MNSVYELKKQIKEYEYQIQLLRRQLEEFQERCEHEFLCTPLMKVCKKCNFMNAEYY